MNRKSKIIVSVVGIFIVLLALFGITYGYFLTRIQGNTNTTSVSVTTADLALVYDGDNGSIIGDNEVIEPNKTFTTKTFTVENKGNTTIDSYAVILDGVSITDVTSGKAVPLKSTRDGLDNDFDLVITCNDGDCNGYTGVLPEENKVLVTNSIEPGEIHTYSVTLKYVDTKKDQSDDMNKRITGKFNIIDTNDTAILTGKVSDMGDSKYYVQTNSTKRVSFIDSNGNYKILGLETGPHTLKLCNMTDTTCENPVMEKDITIKTGNAASGNNSTGEITINNDYKVASIGINADSKTTTISETIEFNNPFNTNTLAYKIINNAKNRTETDESNGYAMFRNTPKNKVAIGPTSYLVYSLVVPENFSDSEYLYEGDYVVYADDYTFDETIGKYTLVNPKIGRIPDICNKLSGKYITTQSSTSQSEANEHVKDGKNFSKIYQIAPSGVDEDYWYEYREYSSESKTIYNYFDSESTLSLTEDDFATSYYYRGNVKDNYINYADMCWRIVRIDGNGNIKLILEDQDQLCDSKDNSNNLNMNGNWDIEKANFGYTEYAYGTLISSKGHKSQTKITKAEYLSGITNPDKSMVKAFENFQSTFTETELSKLKPGNWCLGDSGYLNEDYTTLIKQNDLVDIMAENFFHYIFYDTYKRFLYANESEVTLKCNGTIMDKFADETTDMYVGTLTAEEAAYAGGITFINDSSYYLINNYQITNKLDFWSLSLYGQITNPDPITYDMVSYGIVYAIKKDGSLLDYSLDSMSSVRPSIVLKAGVEINKGTGIQTDPYEIKMN